MEVKYSTKIIWCIIVVLQFALLVYLFYSRRCLIPTDESWDMLLFVQSWPLTYCVQWRETATGNKCNLPQNNSWTIHGIWPTKTGTTGPENCPLSVPFNRTVLLPIMDQLNTSWATLQYGQDPFKFWKHEWTKHGKCAYNDSSFNSELKYFNQGLNWWKQYNISDMLFNAGLHPSDNFTVGDYSAVDFSNAIKKQTYRYPFIECYFSKKFKHHFLAEIYICFNRQLDIIDCYMGNKQKAINGDAVATDCPLKKNIIFPKTSPLNSTDYEFTKRSRDLDV